MDAGLGVRVALHADGLAWSFARAGVGLGPLAAHRQSAHVPDATITFDALQPFEVHANFTAQVAFYDVPALLNGMDNLRKLLFGQILRADARIDIGVFQNLLRVGRTDAINVAQRDVDALVRRNFHSNDACHKSTLPLFVPFVRANHTNDTATPHDFAVLAQFFN